MKMDMSQYLDVFLEESKEHLGNLNQQLLELEKNSSNSASLNEIFRAAHTLKGMSSTMGFDELADLTHHMENVLSDLKEGSLQVNTYVIDTLFKCFDRLQLMIERIENGETEKTSNSDLLQLLDNIKSGEVAEQSESELGEEKSNQNSSMAEDSLLQFNDYDITVFKEAVEQGFNVYYIKVKVDSGCVMKTVRVFMVFKTLEEDGEIVKSLPSAQELEEGKFEEEFELVYLCKNEQLLIEEKINKISELSILNMKQLELGLLIAGNESNRAKSDEISHNEHGETDHKRSPKIKQTVRVDIDRLDKLMNLVGELVMHKGRLEQIGANEKISELNEAIEQIDRISSDLQSVVMKVRMVPIENVFNRFPRMVRDLAKELDKEVDFFVEGKETELDRTVIDEIGDPLVHLLRNSLDHGLESAEDRIKKGKSGTGNVMLRARHEGNNVYIEVEDDGRGINTNEVIEKGVEKGLISAKQAEQMTKEDAIDLLFTPGFSTASAVTDVSGRGVGLDVVRSKIESLNGEIQVESREGKGTRFRIKLPLTLAIIQALMVAVKDEIYAIPLSSVDETTMITKDEVKMIQNQEVIMLRGKVLPLFRLNTMLELPGDNEEDEMYVVVVRKGEQQIGLIVDTLIGQQEIVIKSLGKLLTGIPGIAGAIVAGDGNVRLILDITTLF